MVNVVSFIVIQSRVNKMALLNVMSRLFILLNNTFLQFLGYLFS